MQRSIDEEPLIGLAKARSASGQPMQAQLSDIPVLPGIQGEQADRRRPGRQHDVSPQLIPLVRDPTRSTADAPMPIAEDGESHDLDTAIGILVGTLLSIPLWALLVLVAWSIL
ncbi:MAG: hypothetical protein KGJ41_17440 [Rhodospirillales bacterium]|nr:hypothetical protein [Rhodospirillales bacterium]